MAICISIHSLRMEGDATDSGTPTIQAKYFNPLPPHGGRPTSCFFPERQRRYFNPLPPHGGRRQTQKDVAANVHFNPLPPHGGRLVCIPNRCQCGDISIHSLRMEGDSAVSSAAVPVSPFQSTPSAWRETPGVADIAAQCQISIHSLRMEGDRISSSHRKTVLHFNPLPPHGGRHLRGCVGHVYFAISIHSLRMEGDIPYMPGK